MDCLSHEVLCQHEDGNTVNRGHDQM